VEDMLKTLWKDIIKPTIWAYVLACAIPGSMASAYYIYSRFF